MTNLIKSDTERIRETRNAKIIKDYERLSSQYPEASENKKAVTLGKEYGMTPVGIIKILKAHGLYQPRTTQP